MSLPPIALFPSIELFLLVALLIFLPIYLVRRSNNNGAQLPPSPWKLPIIGNLHQLGTLPHRSLRLLSNKHGPLMLLHLGSMPTLVVSSAEAAREVLRTHDLIFSSRPSSIIAHVMLYKSSDMAFSPYGEHWRQMRKLCVTHLLSNKMVHSFGLVRQVQVEKMMERISSSIGDVVDMSEVLFSYSNNLIGRVVSEKLREEGRGGLFRELIEENISLFGEFHVGDYIPWLGWLDSVFFGLTARAERNSRRWDDVLDELIREVQDERSRREHDFDVLGGRFMREQDFVDVLLSVQKDPNKADFEITMDHVKALILDMFAAGTDTSYIVLEWALAELVRNPEVMKKLVFEVRGISGGKASVNEEDIKQMIYLKAVLKETLRMHPPAPLLIPRESMENCKIKGYDIPKQTRVIINGWAIGRDPKSWEEPEKFRPEKFINSPIDFRGNDFQFIPFGGGRRICPGINLAVSTTELALANLVFKFKWELPSGMRKKDLDMAEAPGLTTRKNQRLNLLVKPYLYGED